MSTSFSMDDVYVNYNFFSEEEVDSFCIKHRTSLNEGWKDAGIVKSGVGAYDATIRKTKIKILKIHKDDTFLVKFFYGVVEANEVKFKLPIVKYRGEGLNLLKYSDDNSKFKIHNDSLDLTNKRALTNIVLLSNPEDYDGGLLYFYTQDPKIPTFKKFRTKLKKGSLITFPSQMFHEVTPVTRGTRMSLVMWSHI